LTLGIPGQILGFEYSDRRSSVSRRVLSNPLALAVLAQLSERPMHPYEISSTLRERGKEQSIKINYGSLYSVVQSLERHSLIAVCETVKDGRRPERTVYAITEPGRHELTDWMSELLSTPVKEYTQFEAALSLAGVLSPDEVTRLLANRLNRLETDHVSGESVLAKLTADGLPELFLVELGYVQAMRVAEIDYVRRLISRIEDGSITGIDMWRQLHDADGCDSPPDNVTPIAEGRS
jgi:DNA-binding PadR family transcriptional regulator